MRLGPKGLPPLWLIVLAVGGLVLAAFTIGTQDVKGMSLFLAAIVGAVATFVLTEWRQARQRITACTGYARLLDAEIEANERVVDELGKYRQRNIFLMSLPKLRYRPPTIGVWPEIGVKLAPLIKAEEFASINEYYRQLRVLVDLEQGRAIAAARGEPLNTFLDRLKHLTQEARRHLSKYANPPLHVRRTGFWW